MQCIIDAMYSRPSQLELDKEAASELFSYAMLHRPWYGGGFGQSSDTTAESSSPIDIEVSDGQLPPFIPQDWIGIGKIWSEDLPEHV
jgi:hypothetical protein